MRRDKVRGDIDMLQGDFIRLQGRLREGLFGGRSMRWVRRSGLGGVG